MRPTGPLSSPGCCSDAPQLRGMQPETGTVTIEEVTSAQTCDLLQHNTAACCAG